MLTLLVIDDDEHIRDLFQAAFEGRYRVVVAAEGRAGLEAFRRESPHAVVLDVRLPGRDGLSVLEAIRRESPDVPVVMVTAADDAETAVAAMKAGAYDYLTKPFDLRRVEVTLANALERARLAEEVRALRADLGGGGRPFVGKSPAVRRVLDLAARVAETNATVLLTGESGTGKELVARMIHDRSPRKAGPFVAVNTAALPATLIEAELFGHEKGAFTGAVARRPGRFEAADGGTILLDEIGCLPLELQPKLLRVLQERVVERLGGTSLIPVDVRVVAATASDLEAEVEAGRFREDLFYRLNVVPIHLPPLRDRPEDIPLLVTHILDRLAERLGKVLGALTPEAMKALLEYRWPGNVRELENVLERIAVVAAPGAPLRLEDIPEKIRGGGGAPAAGIRPGMTLEEVEAEAIRATLEAEGGNVTRAAAVLGVTRKTLREKAKRYGIRG